MKKFVFSLLALVVIFSLFSISASAAGGLEIVAEVTPSTNVHPGDTITVTLSVRNNPGTIVGLSGQINLPGNLQAKNAATDPQSSGLFPSFHKLNPVGNEVAITFGNGTDLVTASSFTLGTFQAEITKQTPVGKQDLSFSEILFSGAQKDEVVPHTESAGSFTVYHRNDPAPNTPPEESDHTWDGGTTTDATCQSEGKTVYKCTDSNCPGTKEVTLSKLPHSWEAVQWNFVDADMQKSTATMKCTGNVGSEHTVTATTVTATPGETDATCTKAGKTTWTLEAQFGEDGDNKKETTTHEVTDQALGHDWATPEWEWDMKDPENAKVTFSIKCNRTDCQYNTSPYSPTVTPTSSDKTEAGCVKPGKITWTAEVTCPDTPSGTRFTNTRKDVTIPALGHQWATNGTWTWDDPISDDYDVIPNASFNVKCLNGDKCENDYDGVGLNIRATVTRDPSSTEPNCTTPGTAKFNAEAVTTGHFEGTEQNPQTFNDSKNKNYDALGHEFVPAAEFVWPETAGDDNKSEPTGVTATLTCTRDNCPAQDHKVNGTNVEVTSVSKKDATYLEAGEYVWKATADFSDGKGKTEQKESGNKPYRIDQLPPPETTADIDSTGSQATVVMDKDTLAATFDPVVEATLAGNAPSWLPTAVKNAILDAGKSAKDDMKVETKLVMKDITLQTPPTGVAALDDVNAAYDIHIEMTISSTTHPSSTVQITQTADELPFMVPVPTDGGPIYYMMRDHDGWSEISSRVSGGNILFSSKLFSNFAVISTSDLKYATIDPNPIPNQTYTGSEIKPAIKVYINGDPEQLLVEGKDYVVKYANNVNVGNGTASITIEPADGSTYTGSQTIYFSIVAKPAASSGSGTKNAPNTGDETPVALYAGILTLSAAALAVVCTRKKKSSR